MSLYLIKHCSFIIQYIQTVRSYCIYYLYIVRIKKSCFGVCFHSTHDTSNVWTIYGDCYRSLRNLSSAWYVPCNHFIIHAKKPIYIDTMTHKGTWYLEWTCNYKDRFWGSNLFPIGSIVYGEFTAIDETRNSSFFRNYQIWHLVRMFCSDMLSYRKWRSSFFLINFSGKFLFIISNRPD